MAETIKTGTILIKDGTFLPEALQFESEPCATDWRLAKDFNVYGLGRKLHEAGWTFFRLAGEIKATIFRFWGTKECTQSSQANFIESEIGEVQRFRNYASCSETISGIALRDCLRPFTTYPGEPVPFAA
jgi:hypothetical protein